MAHGAARPDVPVATPVALCLVDPVGPRRLGCSEVSDDDDMLRFGYDSNLDVAPTSPY